MKKVILSLVICFISFLSVTAQTVKPEVIQVADSLFMVANMGGNVAFLITNEGVIVVDACENPEQASLLMRIIKEKTNQPVKYVIYTHYHFDHTGGVMGFPSGINTIGHENIAKNFININIPELKKEIEQVLPDTISKLEKLVDKQKLKKDKNLKSTEDLLKKMLDALDKDKQIRCIEPNISFTEKMTINLGGQNVEIVYPGKCHTSCNCYVIFKNKNVLHTGDLLFNHAHPYIDIAGGANTDNWAKKLIELSNMGFKAVIPGHMALTDCASLRYGGEFISFLRVKVKEQIDKGKSLEEIKKNIQLGEYDKLNFQFLRNQNIEAVYSELTVKN